MLSEAAAAALPEPAIADHALLGDTATAALVTRDGTISWWCPDRFDAPAVFLSILDPARGGSCTLRFPGGPPTAVTRAYVPDTNVLETTFALPGGRLRVTDFLAVHAAGEPAPAHGSPDGVADGQLVRLFTCLEGRVAFAVGVNPTFDYARAGAEWSRPRDNAVLFRSRADPAGQRLVAWAGGPFSPDDSLAGGTFAFALDAGQAGAVLLGTDPLKHLHDLTPGGILARAERARSATVAYWRHWSAERCYRGPYPGAVSRSLLALKALTYGPTGAIVAAPTLGLPEAVGGGRNYDYRYTWLRDAGFTVRAFLTGGHQRDAAAFLRLLERIARRGDSLQVLYDLDGQAPPVETPLDHLTGHRDSRPVSLGNAAADQLQHDVLGESVNALFTYWEMTGEPPPLGENGSDHLTRLAALVRRLADAAADCWRDPDQGVWEVRGAPQHFFHSKALCWLALDRSVKMAPQLGLDREAVRWAQERDAVRADYLEHGWNAARGAYTQSYGSPRLDAAVLRTALFDALDPADPRLHATMALVERELGRDDLLFRYAPEEEGTAPAPGAEGAFTSCGFWLANVQALAGQTRRATARFEALLARANDVGLFAEETDPATGEMIAFSCNSSGRPVLAIAGDVDGDEAGMLRP